MEVCLLADPHAERWAEARAQGVSGRAARERLVALPEAEVTLLLRGRAGALAALLGAGSAYEDEARTAAAIASAAAAALEEAIALDQARWDEARAGERPAASATPPREQRASTSYFELLGVAPGATPAEVEAAFAQRIGGAGPEARRELEAARAVLGRPEVQRAYAAANDRRPGPQGAPPRRLPTADRLPTLERHGDPRDPHFP